MTTTAAPPASPSINARYPWEGPMTSTTKARWCDVAVVFSRSIASSAVLRAVSERLELVLDQPGVALSDAGHLEPARHTDAHHGPERRVHPRRVPPARQHRNPLHPLVLSGMMFSMLTFGSRSHRAPVFPP